MLAYIREITDFIFLEDAPQKADILFVPGNGHAAPSELAARLYREGFAPRVLPSGRYAIGLSGFQGQISGSRRYEGAFDTEWAFMRHILMKNGVPESAVLREDEATYTYQNAINTRKLLDERKIEVKRAILCCQAYHARRSKLYYQILFPDTEILVCPTVTKGITRDNWFKSRETADIVLGEIERCGSQFHEIVAEYGALEKN